jgi:hypothetical protein
MYIPVPTVESDVLEYFITVHGDFKICPPSRSAGPGASGGHVRVWQQEWSAEPTVSSGSRPAVSFSAASYVGNILSARRQWSRWRGFPVLRPAQGESVIIY